MRQCRRGMTQRHVGYREVTARNQLRRLERRHGDLGDVRASASADPGLATIGGWRFLVIAGVDTPCILMFVAGHAVTVGRADLPRYGCLLDMHAGRSNRATNPVQHEGGTEQQAQEGRRNHHRATLSHFPESGV